MYNLQKNNYHQKPKNSNIQTPLEERCAICSTSDTKEEQISCSFCQRVVCRWRPCVEIKNGKTCRDCYAKRYV